MAETMSAPVEMGAEEFARLADPFRRELLAHCYRMLGSVHDAEDLVQETYLRAWRSYAGFEGRSSLRTWLHRIATTACLTALDSRARRPLPAGLGDPSREPERPVVAAPAEATWLEPIPDHLLDDEHGDPATIVVARESTRLAFVAALQHLPARQRAVLILRDVLKLRAAEVADLLGTTTAAANSALQRARAQLEAVGPTEEGLVEPSDDEQRALLERYVAAFETADIPALMGVLKDDAVWEMPPFLDWFVGNAAIVRLIAAQCPGGPDSYRLRPASANGQPAFALYIRDAEGVLRGHSVQVLTVAAGRVSHVVAFFDPEVFAMFGPAVWPEPRPADR